MRDGGFGIMFAINMVDDLIYSEEGNEVTLVKYLSQRVNRDELPP